MAYIGVQPTDTYLSIASQQITGTGSATYTLDYSVSNEEDVAVFVNNVRQNVSSYTVSGNQLTLGGTISASDECWVLFLGRTVGTKTPAVGSVTDSMMSYPLTNFSSTDIDVTGKGTFSGAGSFEALELITSDTNRVYVTGNSSVSGDMWRIGTSASNPYLNIDGLQASSGILFRTGGTNERMRIDSSGNALVGKTTITGAFNTVGTELRANGLVQSTVDGSKCFDANRKTSDGDIIGFSKDGSAVGSISVWNTHIGIVQGNTRLEIDDGSNAIFFTNNTNGGLRDNTTDLGKSNARLDDIFATNGTIQTSDQNEKQSIQSLSASEIAVAQRISKLFKTFKFNSSVEEKGDSARTHTGIIAQDVQQAFVDEGLDASNYALFISSTWWEKEISVDAVAEELDEEGNVLVEGKDAYTYIDTKEEATEGYTERTRLGIRYPELLSFVSSAFEQRLTNIETRIATLENA